MGSLNAVAPATSCDGMQCTRSEHSISVSGGNPAAAAPPRRSQDDDHDRTGSGTTTTDAAGPARGHQLLYRAGSGPQQFHRIDRCVAAFGDTNLVKHRWKWVADAYEGGAVLRSQSLDKRKTNCELPTAGQRLRRVLSTDTTAAKGFWVNAEEQAFAKTTTWQGRQ